MRMCCMTRLERIKYENIKGNLEVIKTAREMKENKCRWFGDMLMEEIMAR